MGIIKVHYHGPRIHQSHHCYLSNVKVDPTKTYKYVTDGNYKIDVWYITATRSDMITSLCIKYNEFGSYLGIITRIAKSFNQTDEWLQLIESFNS